MGQTSPRGADGATCLHGRRTGLLRGVSAPLSRLGGSLSIL
jgi:hypothetical protein